jgi:hypothetical protein
MDKGTLGLDRRTQIPSCRGTFVRCGVPVDVVRFEVVRSSAR